MVKYFLAYQFEGATPTGEVRIDGLASAQNYLVLVTTTTIYRTNETSLSPLSATTGKTSKITSSVD
jgi:hypothetical protein